MSEFTENATSFVDSKEDHYSDACSSDSDEEPPPEESLQIWKLPPDESLSDWTIEIVTERSGGHCLSEGATAPTVDTYHVHKAILAYGPRKSEYFRRLFANDGRFAESSTSTSRIELKAMAAELFPEVLNYVYDPHQKLKISTESATALYHLGSYFSIRNLKWDVKQFYNEDMCESNCGTYYEHGYIFQTEKILEKARIMCYDNIKDIDPESSRLLHVPDLDFWMNFRLERPDVLPALSLHLSNLIGTLCDNVDVDAKAFEVLTSKEYLPSVDFDGALKLIEYENIILRPNPKELSCLQERCVQGLAEHWDVLDLNQGSVAELLAQQTPLLSVELLKKCLAKSTAKCSGLETSTRLLKKQNGELINEKNELETEFRKLHPVRGSIQFMRDEQPTVTGCPLTDGGSGTSSLTSYTHSSSPYFHGPRFPVYYYE